MMDRIDGGPAISEKNKNAKRPRSKPYNAYKRIEKLQISETAQTEEQWNENRKFASC